MGLDMYLEKCNRKAWGYKDFDIDDVKENNPALYEEIKPFLTERGHHFKWESIFEQVGYWRKANAIHKWFVDNVQNGNDNCEYYEVSKKQLEELLDVCKTVSDSCILVDGKIQDGYTFDKKGNKIYNYVDGKYIKDTSIAKELLPTQSGFFFGGTEYDQWYLDDVTTTIEILTEVLKETDFDREIIAYISSW